jgi:hypothetical protein
MVSLEYALQVFLAMSVQCFVIVVHAEGDALANPIESQHVIAKLHGQKVAEAVSKPMLRRQVN